MHNVNSNELDNKKIHNKIKKRNDINLSCLNAVYLYNNYNFMKYSCGNDYDCTHFNNKYATTNINNTYGNPRFQCIHQISKIDSQLTKLTIKKHQSNSNIINSNTKLTKDNDNHLIGEREYINVYYQGIPTDLLAHPVMQLGNYDINKFKYVQDKKILFKENNDNNVNNDSHINKIFKYLINMITIKIYSFILSIPGNDNNSLIFIHLIIHIL